MANTYSVGIVNTGWTDISQANTSGFFTNRSDAVILFRQADSLPAPSVEEGHRLNPAADAVNFTVTGSDRIYARSLEATGLIIVTP